MSAKLLADPKVAALVEKQVAAAVKAEQKRVAEVVKTHLAEAKNLGDKVAKASATNSLKAVLADLKA